MKLWQKSLVVKVTIIFRMQLCLFDAVLYVEGSGLQPGHDDCEFQGEFLQEQREEKDVLDLDLERTRSVLLRMIKAVRRAVPRSFRVSFGYCPFQMP